MGSKLQDEIKQAVPFVNLQEEVWLNLSRTASVVGHELEQQLRPHGLSPTQYNVLRILRGAGLDGLCQYEISDRLVAQVPDVPRILDRMERAGWVKRARGVTDRRVVMASLTESGLGLVNTLDRSILDMMSGMFIKLNESELGRLNELLVAARTFGRD